MKTVTSIHLRWRRLKINNLVRCVTKLTDSLGQLNYIASAKQTTGGLKLCTFLLFTLPMAQDLWFEERKHSKVNICGWVRRRYWWPDVFRAFKGPLIVVEFFFLLFYFSCWRPLTRARQAIRHLTGHLNWPLCNKISGLLSAVPRPFELAFMQQQGDIRAAQCSPR